MSASAQQDEASFPVLITADRITHDENLGIVVASGNVELSRGQQVVLADSVSYNMRTEVVSASGNVSLLDPDGHVVFANFAELTGDLREGFIRDVRILLSDRSRLAAATGYRVGGNRSILNSGVFSPCELCREDPTRAPLWQIKAAKVEHDQDAKVIRYRDAWIEFFGIPIFYTPYFEHPDPTVDRQSGFLAPTFGASEVLGTTYQQSYFWAISEDKDFTFSPIFTTKRGVVGVGRYRQVFANGAMDLRGSATIADRERSDGSIDNDDFRGHIDSTARFDINDAYRAGVDVQRTTDDTYMRLYDISSAQDLTSRAFVEGFNGRNYLAVNNYLYQGLRSTDRNSELPIIHPLAQYNYMSDPGVAGGKYTLDASLLALTRSEGRDSRRLSVALGWELPYTGPAGDVYNLVARVQGDGYWVDGVDPNSNEVNPANNTENGLTGRVFPEIALQWRYPWVRHSGTMHQVIEPIAQVVLAPNGSNPGKIPNEDSQDFEFDDNNLFSLNRFTGVDRVTSGSRADYGLKWTVTGDGGGWASAFVGQSYRLHNDSVFEEGSGVEDKLSDIVGRVEIKPTYALDLRYRFRIDKDDFSARRNEFDLRIGPPALSLDLGYVFIDPDAQADEFGGREELAWLLHSRLSKYWSAFGGIRVDIEEDETREARIGLTYDDECFRIQAVGRRSFFSDREIEPEDSVYVNFVFKHLGGTTGTGTGGL
ncbi:MAG: LPS-assembly protein LptD [Alphaproteobacteria bacterium]